MARSERRAVVIGGGMGGLGAAVALAARGVSVELLERAERPGGKNRHLSVAGRAIDAGPTVCTMAWVFEELFAEAGADFHAEVRLHPAETLARHAWDDDPTTGAPVRMDLFADIDRSADAIAAFAGPREAAGYRAFCAEGARIYSALEKPFLRSLRPTPHGLVAEAGLAGLVELLATKPLVTLDRAVSKHFRDPRLRQLFGRYATYCGSSPYDAIGTLMLVAHVEQEGVWLVEGGMRPLADALVRQLERLGGRVRCQAHVAAIETACGRTSAVRLADGQRIEADAVVFNGDPAALADGLLGPEAAGAIPGTPQRKRSLSALAFALVAEAEGFPLLRHTVFFGSDYPEEFRAIFRERRAPADPTVYVCAQERGDSDLAGDGRAGAAPGPERILMHMNMPPDGDVRPLSRQEIEQCTTRIAARLKRCGLTLTRPPEAEAMVTPTDFNGLFPATGGALYGRTAHGWMASFQRPGGRTAIPGLYLAGGACHPGPGVPMATMSGRLAGAAAAADLLAETRRVPASIRLSRPAAISGGMSTG